MGKFLDNYDHMAGMWIVGEYMPQESNRVTLNTSEKDQNGMPVPNAHFDDHENDLKMRKHAFGKGTDVYKAAGALDVFETPPYPSTHNLGTCRMSAKPRDGVCDKNGTNLMILLICSYLMEVNLQQEQLKIEHLL